GINNSQFGLYLYIGIRLALSPKRSSAQKQRP
ncbi:MAG: hypothetical protein ACI9LS_002024, partial [Flavobacteriales bacterium]